MFSTVILPFFKHSQSTGGESGSDYQAKPGSSHEVCHADFQEICLRPRPVSRGEVNSMIRMFLPNTFELNII